MFVSQSLKLTSRLLLRCSPALCLLAAACHNDWAGPEDKDASTQSPAPEGSSDPAPSLTTTTPADGTVPDATLPDAGPDDASSDAPTSADAATPVMGCTDGPTGASCDLEQGALDDIFSWLELTTASGATLTLVNEGQAPGPRVLKSTLSGAGNEGARAVYRLPSAPASLHVAFDFLPRLNLAPMSTDVVPFFKFQQPVGNSYPGFMLVARRNGNFIILQNGDGVTDPSWVDFPLKEFPQGWVHIDIDVTFSLTAGTLTVRFNGVEAGSVPAQRIGSTGTITHHTAGFGLSSAEKTASSAFYDNLVVELKPQ